MIIPNQTNIKVHFAGAEKGVFAHCFAMADVRYLLFSAFYPLARILDIKHAGYWGDNKRQIWEELEYLQVRHSIMDSGLFTLIFGAHAQKRTSKEIELWYHSLVDHVRRNKIPSTCVEVDCQKILGVKKAWELRIRMRKDLPDNRIINVFHIEDGMKGLDRMIDFSDYIAVSVPELRKIGKKMYLPTIVNHIKNRKPGIDIHLLGCTEKKILQQLSFCTSSDSTSWTQINKFGNIGGFRTSNLKKESMQKYHDEAKYIIDRYNMRKSLKAYDYLSRAIIACKHLKAIYTKYAGDQN